MEHDPSIGVESVATLLPTGLLMIFIGASIIMTVAIATVKLRKKAVNVISVE